MMSGEKLPLGFLGSRGGRVKNLVTAQHPLRVGSGNFPSRRYSLGGKTAESERPQSFNYVGDLIITSKNHYREQDFRFSLIKQSMPRIFVALFLGRRLNLELAA
jgi:hypothetical protein